MLGRKPFLIICFVGLGLATVLFPVVAPSIPAFDSLRIAF
jgi:hypothetical protein